MSSDSIDDVLRQQIKVEAADQEQTAVEEVHASLHLLKASVNRLVTHRRIHGQILSDDPRIDFLLVDRTLKTCQDLMRL